MKADRVELRNRSQELKTIRMPEKPSFPIIMFLFAIIKDFFIDILLLGMIIVGSAISSASALVLAVPVIGWLIGLLGASIGLTLSITGWILSILMSFIFYGIFILWLFFKPDTYKKTLLRRSVLRIPVGIGLSWIPLLGGLVPEMTYIVWATYRTEIKEWRKEYAKAKLSPATQTSKKAVEKRRMIAQMRRRDTITMREEREERREVERIRKQQELLANAA